MLVTSFQVFGNYPLGWFLTLHGQLSICLFHVQPPFPLLQNKTGTVIDNIISYANRNIAMNGSPGFPGGIGQDAYELVKELCNMLVGNGKKCTAPYTVPWALSTSIIAGDPTYHANCAININSTGGFGAYINTTYACGASATSQLNQAAKNCYNLSPCLGTFTTTTAFKSCLYALPAAIKPTLVPVTTTTTKAPTV